ncbi:aspartate--tRNA ligase [Gloeobacter morelensis]|uniref:Aspartate--tRNA(Asp/Asn) ligase n=1 Tax=Gloeobacter morelensis MG652769 TaxID=2781736 RepID=A0ABY3PM35_9CYAN|nr:aspartate--tRNA ligase [Gloeobacter morelensis]UFP94707.1 aspartate--tRNA ligase [Gloeobacter morelensis MG652769]
MRSDYCGTLRSEHIGKTVSLYGWIDGWRDHGGVIFLDLRDYTGIVQIVADPQRTPESYPLASSLRNEYVVRVEGRVSARPEHSLNPRLSTGTIEVYADTLAVLNRAETPPFAISKDEEVDEKLRLKFRYLDLRRGRMQKLLRLRHRVMQIVRRHLDERGFSEIETPVLVKSTPEGARDYLVPSRVNPGDWFALPQSPQLFKQLLMVAGFDRYYQIARCFRDEDLRADRQPEFTQLDMEMSFLSMEEILALNEGLVAAILQETMGLELSLPLPRLTYAEAMARYGSDKPDTRFGLELIDVSEVFRESSFQVLSGAVAAGGKVVCLPVPHAETITNTRVKPGGDLFEFVTQFGARGLLFARVREGGQVDTIGAFSKSLTPEIAADLIEKTGAQPGHLLLFGAGDRTAVPTVLDYMGRLRLKVGEELGFIDPNRHNLLWVTDFPMFEWNAEEKRLEALHHPFTAPRPEDEHDLKTARALAYDIIWNGVEVGGGSLRIYRRDLQERVFETIGLTEEEARAKFGFLLDAFEYGTPPHGGIAYGFDRFVMLIAGEQSIREVIAFPKTQRAQDLMLGAPAAVAERQLKELNVRSTLPPKPQT